VETRLRQVVDRLLEARARRGDVPPELDAALAVLVADHAAPSGDDERASGVAGPSGCRRSTSICSRSPSAPDLDATFGAAYAALQATRAGCGPASAWRWSCAVRARSTPRPGTAGPAGPLRRGDWSRSTALRRCSPVARRARPGRGPLAGEPTSTPTSSR
jgi:hypothetical protein